MWPFAKTRAETSVRPVTERWSAACARIHAAAFHRGWTTAEMDRLIADPSVIGHVALDSSEQALWGFSLTRRAAQEAEILTIAVDPAWRNHGVGRALMRAQLSALRARGVEELFLEVEARNASALALYSRFSFRQVGERKAYYAKPGEPAALALILRCDLA